MKKAIIISILALTVNYSFGQKHYNQSALDKFIGTWEYSSQGKDFKVILGKGNLSMGGVSIDIIQGRHFYSLDNKIIESTLDSTKPSIYNGAIANKEKSLLKIKFIFNDPIKKREVIGYLELQQGKMNEALWTLRNRESVTINAKKTREDFSFSVPTNIILHKIDN